MVNWLKQDWFKLTIAAAVILVTSALTYKLIFDITPVPPIDGEEITEEAFAKTIFYTKNSTNIRECPSLDCAVINQYEPNFAIELPYKSVDEMPEWIMTTWKVNDIEKNGYVSKLTLSQTRNENTSSVQQPTNSYVNNTESIIEYGINFLVALTCLTPPGNEGIISASGIVIGFGTTLDGRKTTYILTNNHVLENSYSNPDQNSYPGLGKYPCVVSWPSETEEGQLASYAAEIYNPTSISKSVMTNIDFGFLRLRERVEKDLITVRENSSLVLANGIRPRICVSDYFKLGKKLIVLGFPSISAGITATEGIISAFDDAYIVTSAKIDQGNSGGPVFLETNSCLVGMATFAKLGVVESLSRLIDIPLLEKQYLGNLFR